MVVNSFSILFEGSSVGSPGLFFSAIRGIRLDLKIDMQGRPIRNHLSVRSGARSGASARAGGTSSAAPERSSIRTKPRGSIDEVIFQDDEILRHRAIERTSGPQVCSSEIAIRKAASKLGDGVDVTVAPPGAISGTSGTFLDMILEDWSRNEALNVGRLGQRGQLLGQSFQDLNTDAGGLSDGIREKERRKLRVVGLGKLGSFASKQLGSGN